MGVGHKRRNSEKRKEKSRDAARCRRGKEAEIFSELASQLPMPMSTIDSLDKASVMRLLLSTLKVKMIMEKRQGAVSDMSDDEIDLDFDKYYPKALEGFLVVLSREGDFIYVSDSVVKFLGLQQIDLMGQSIYEFAHPCDHEEIQEVLAPHAKAEDREMTKTIFIRLKCTLTSKGRSVNLKSATYKVIKLTGRFVPDDASPSEEEEVEVAIKTEEEDDYDSEGEERVRPFKPQHLPHFLGIGEAIHHPSNIEVPLDKRTFTTRHSMNMKFTDCDERIHRLIGYKSEDLIGHSFYAYHHAIDSKMMGKAFKDLFSKGQITTGQYRFLAKNGGYVWMVTEATVIFNSRTQKPECVVCVHYVLSRVEQHGRVLSNVQLEEVSVKEEKDVPSQCEMVRAGSTSPKPSRPTTRASRKSEVKVEDIFHIPTFSTEAVFFDRTADMEKEFLFSSGIKKMKTCDSQMNVYENSTGFDSKAPKSDLPLIRDTARRGDPQLASPGSVTPEQPLSGKASPVAYLSTINATDINAMGELFTNIDTGMDQEIDFSTRAPFIPMTADEDFVLSQPSQDCLLGMGADFNPGIYGCTESVFSLKDELYDGPTESKSKSARDMLGDSTIMKSIEQPQDKMIMKMKRALDRSQLEKGPPMKMTKYQPPVGLRSDHKVVNARDNSVLMNLLLKGEDVDNGYSMKRNISPRRDSATLLQNLLTSVTSQDVEMNAPTNTGLLLQGQDIMAALNMDRK